MEWAQVLPDRGQLASGGTCGIRRHRWCTVAGQTARQESARFPGREPVRVDEKPRGIAGEIAAGGELHDGHTREGQMVEGSFGTLQEKPVAVANADDPRDGMFAAKLGGAHEDFKFAGTFADCVTG